MKNADNSQVIQSVWHDATIFSQKEAKDWCIDHDFKADVYRKREKDGEITHHIHAQFDTSEAIDNTWKVLTDDFPDGITASTCQRKEKAMEMKY